MRYRNRLEEAKQKRKSINDKILENTSWNTLFELISQFDEYYFDRQERLSEFDDRYIVINSKDDIDDLKKYMLKRISLYNANYLKKDPTSEDLHISENVYKQFHEITHLGLKDKELRDENWNLLNNSIWVLKIDELTWKVIDVVAKIIEGDSN